MRMKKLLIREKNWKDYKSKLIQKIKFKIIKLKIKKRLIKQLKIKVKMT